MGVTETGGVASAWADVLSGNGRTFTASGDPAYDAADSDFLGLATLNFDETDNFFQSDDAASTWRFLHDGTGMFVWVVCKIDSGGTGVLDSLITTTNGANTGLRFSVNYTDGETTALIHNGTGTIASPNSDGGTNDVVQSLACSYVESGSPTEVIPYVNDAADTGADTSGAPAAGDPFGTMHIGARPGGAAHLLGLIHEIVIATAVPTAAQAAALNAYATSRGYY